MDAMRSSIDDRSYSIFDAALSSQMDEDRTRLESAEDARPFMEAAIRNTMKVMRERRCNETVTGVAGVKEAIMTGRAAARRNVMLDSDPIVISSIHRDDETASITSAITNDSVEESAVGIDVDSLRDEMSVGTAVEHAVRTCSVQSVVNTFKTHYDSEYLWDNEDFCILIYTLQFTTERVSSEINPRDLGPIKSVTEASLAA
jgi:hypothetical protein